MNGANSDNGVSIQKMVTPNMVGRNLVTPNMVAWNLGTLNMATPNFSEPGYADQVFNVGDQQHNYFLTLRNSSNFFFNLTANDILVQEHGCMY